VRTEYAPHVRALKRQTVAKTCSRGLPVDTYALRSQNEGIRLRP
jgi:hypothetical protein